MLSKNEESFSPRLNMETHWKTLGRKLIVQVGMNHGFLRRNVAVERTALSETNVTQMIILTPKVRTKTVILPVLTHPNSPVDCFPMSYCGKVDSSSSSAARSFYTVLLPAASFFGCLTQPPYWIWPYMVGMFHPFKNKKSDVIFSGWDFGDPPKVLAKLFQKFSSLGR